MMAIGDLSQLRFCLLLLVLVVVVVMVIYQIRQRRNYPMQNTGQMDIVAE